MSELQPADFLVLRKLLRESAGFVLEEDKGYVVETRLLPVLDRVGLSSISQLVARLASDPGLRRTTVDAMLNGETTFFRDPAVFEALRAKVLPELLAEPGRVSPVQIWAAACSTGQEPYSLAMLLDDAFEGLPPDALSLWATDLSEAHLTRARRGRYTQFEVNRGLPARLLVKYFDQVEGDWVVSARLRERVTFARLNLIEDWPPLPSMDVMLLRNAMIYWEADTKVSVLGKVHAALRPGGRLILGGAETVLDRESGFERDPSGPACIFRKIR